MAFARITEPLEENRQESRGLGGNDRGLVLQHQAFNEMAQGRETRRHKGCRGSGADGKTDAVENGRLAVVRNAIVLDTGLEVVEQLKLCVDNSGRLLQGSQEGGSLLLHGSVSVIAWVSCERGTWGSQCRGCMGKGVVVVSDEWFALGPGLAKQIEP